MSVDNTVPPPVVQELKDIGAAVIDRTELGWPGHSRMLWRFLPLIEDRTVDVLLSRDCDSVLYDCDQRTVEAWIDRGKALTMTMRDSISHGQGLGQGIYYLGGMCGFRKCRKWPLLMDTIYGFANSERNSLGAGIDQAWLGEVVFPVFKDSYEECGFSSFGECEYPIVGIPGRNHVGAPDGPEADFVDKMNWRVLFE
jgi:hypothetical protein